MKKQLFQVFCFAALCFFSAPMAVTAEELLTEVSRDALPVSPSFVGQEITLFGTILGEQEETTWHHPYDVVIVIRGPRENNEVRRKDRVLGIWLNHGKQVYNNVPSYLLILSQGPVQDVAPIEKLHEHQIGFEGFFLKSVVHEEEKESFRHAFLRLKREAGLYQQTQNSVRLLDRKTFFARADLPANLPIGDYTIEFYLFRGGEFLASKIHKLDVFHAGIGADIFTLSKNYPLLYGFFTLFGMMLVAYLLHLLLRKD